MEQEINNKEKYNNQTDTWKLLIALLIAGQNMSMPELISIQTEVGTIPKLVIVFKYHWNNTQTCLP